MKIPSMDEMIEECRKQQSPEEMICFAFGVGRMVPLLTDSLMLRRSMKKALKYIKGLDGFLGIHPLSLENNLLIFDTLNNAKGGRNLLKTKDVAVGEIAPILVYKDQIGRENE